MGDVDRNIGMSEEDKATLEQELAEELDWGTPQPENILVRGALLECDCGTHPRRMNLPKSYGSYVDEEMEHPFVSEKDCLFCTEGARDGNITFFGVCESENNDSPDKEEVCLRPYGDTSTVENKIGTKCKPVIVGQWLNPVKESYVEEDGKKYLKIKSQSVLICKYGGIIRVKESGQTYEEET